MKAEDIMAAANKVADLKVQAMMFDMDIDIETFSLTPKNTHKDAVWIKNWKAKREASDFDEYFDIDKE